MALPLILAGAGAAGGFIGGLSDDVTEQKLILPEEEEFERQLRGDVQGDFQSFRDLIGAGPGIQDVRAGLTAQRGFASTLAQLGHA